MTDNRDSVRKAGHELARTLILDHGQDNVTIHDFARAVEDDPRLAHLDDGQAEEFIDYLRDLVHGAEVAGVDFTGADRATLEPDVPITSWAPPESEQ